MSSRPAKTSRTEVVVLKGMDYGERDKILTLYTPYMGKLHAIAKGVRRVTSRMGGHVDVLSHATVLLIHGRTLDIVTQGQGLQVFAHLREDLPAFARACYAAELVDRFTPDANPNPEIFRALVRVLEHIDKGNAPELAVLLFQLQLLALSGYRPQLHRCVSCDAAIAPGDNYFDAALGGVVCPACAPAQTAAHPISTPTLKLLRNLQTRGERMFAVDVPPEIRAGAENALSLYVQYLLERRPHAAAFLDALRHEDAVAGSR